MEGRMTKHLAVKAVVMGFVVFILSAALARPQAARIEIKDGVEIVRNFKSPGISPGSPRSLTLDEELRIGKSEGDEEYMFGFLRSVQVDAEGNIYTADAEYTKIRIYDKAGRHLRSFGTSGQGPCELDWLSRMVMMKDGSLAVLHGRRLTVFSKDGTCLREISLAKAGSIIRAWPDSRGRFYCDRFNMTPEGRSSELVRFDEKFETAERIAAVEEKLTFGQINPILFRIVFNILPDDRLFWADNREYAVHVVDASGRTVRTILKEDDPVPVTDAERKAIEEERRKDGMAPTLKLVFPGRHPAIDYFVCDENGRLFVRTNAKNKDGWKRWDVFDERGVYLLSFHLPEEDVLFTIREEKAYAIGEETEAGTPVVKRFKMIWK
jgi:hypothetical protein